MIKSDDLKVQSLSTPAVSATALTATTGDVTTLTATTGTITTLGSTTGTITTLGSTTGTITTLSATTGHMGTLAATTANVNYVNANTVNSGIAIVDGDVDTVLTVAQTGSIVLLNSNDVVTLPAVLSNERVFYKFIVQTVATQAPRIDPNESEVINLQGTDLTGGKYAAATAIGDCLTLFCDGAKWWSIDSYGTWTYEDA
jgi:hypothetical protein